MGERVKISVLPPIDNCTQPLGVVKYVIVDARVAHGYIACCTVLIQERPKKGGSEKWSSS